MNLSTAKVHHNSANPNRNGWRARLDLDYYLEHDRTLLFHKHEGPLRVQRPFFPEGIVNHTYLLHPPGGMVGNDRLEIQAEVGDAAHALITTPGATKAYRNILDEGVIRQRFNVRGHLEWLPQELILFDGSRVRSETVYDLHPGAKLLAWEIQCLGRPVGEFPYLNGAAHFRTQVTLAGDLLLQDDLHLAAESPLMDSAWGLHGATAVGVMLAYPGTPAMTQAVREELACVEDHASVTALDDVLVIRAQARQAQEVRRIFVRVWEVLRPELMLRHACLPRIWAT